MEKKEAQEALEYLKKNSQKRKFNQSYDLIINLKDLNLKQPEQHVDIFVPLHYSKGKKAKICALVGPELKDQAKEVCDFAVTASDFPKYEANKKLAKKLAGDYDFFIAQATIMPQIAKSFGRVFGPRGKMPNPKAGCVVAPNANLKPVYEKLQKTIRLVAKVQPSIKCQVGSEEMKDEEVLDNIMNVYNQVIHHLPNEKNNIKNVLLKMTMSKPFRVGAKPEEKKEAKTEEKKEAKKEAPKTKPEEKKEEPKEKAKPKEKKEAKPKKKEEKAE